MSMIGLPAVLLGLTLIGVFVVRTLSIRVRIVFDLVAFLAFTALLAVRHQSPFFMTMTSVGVDDAWLRAAGVAWWLLGARVVVAAVRLVLGHSGGSREARLFSDLVAAAIYIAAVLAILNSVLDLPVKGLLATSGVIAIVFGLALQNTLADVFAGIAVGIEQPFRVGDRVLLGDHIEGRVVQINWRSIRIETDDDDVATIPNSLVAKSEIINRSYPSEQRMAKVETAAVAQAPPERILELLLQATLLCPGILDKPAPSAWLIRMGQRSNAYAVSFAVAGVNGLAATKSLLLVQIRRQFHFAGLLADDPTAAVPGILPPAEMLRGLVLFESLDATQIAALANHLHLRTLGQGQTLFVEGDTEPTLYVIAAGVVEVTRTIGGRSNQTVGRIAAGEYIGEVTLLTGAPRIVTVTAVSPVQVYELSRDALVPLFKDTADLMPAFERSVQRGLNLRHRDEAARACEDLDTPGRLL
ncbi:MAG: cyclic nucleotide-binding domain-containing protein, partial [Janthinobacterium lividum]